MALGQIIMSLVILVTAVYFYLNTLTFPSFAQYGSVDSDFWPKIVLGLLIFCSAMLLLENYRRRRAHHDQGQGKKEDYDPKGLIRMLGTGALLLFYVFIGLQYLGFLLSTLIFTAALMYWLGNRKPVTIALVSVLSSSLFMVIFCRLMLIPLPRGEGLFRTFSLLFY